MTIHNSEIAATFSQVADLLEIEGANSFRVRAYRNAARLIAGLSKNVAELLEEKVDLTTLPGIGKDLAEKINTIVKTGELPLLKEIEARTPPILSELMTLEGLGPKRVQILYRQLNIHSLKDLQKALKNKKIRQLKGFGEKTEKHIAEGLKHQQEYSKRFKLADAIPLAETLLRYLKKSKAVQQLECAGSFRRHKDTVGDLDIVVTTKDSKKVMDHFLQFEEITEIISRGSTRSSVHLHSGMQVDLRVVPTESYGAALLYFTGSKEHNISIRKLAVQQKLKLNEYGIFKGNNKKPLASRTEKAMYKVLGLPYIEPELREDRGEIEAAQQKKLPTLISLKDLRGDLHCHTQATDGKNSMAEMAKAAATLGHEYLAITDHTKHLTVAHGFSPKQVLQQIKAIDRLNNTLKGLVVLKAMEVDILEDGSLDLPDDILKELDLTICSVHYKFDLPAIKQTERIIRAMDNPYFNILAHPTGRLINKRAAYQIDMDQIMKAAKERHCILEVNAQPERLDLNDIYCKRAKELGVKLAISSDSHDINSLAHLRFGIYQARRGWIEKKDVVNTLPLEKLKQLLRRKS